MVCLNHRESMVIMSFCVSMCILRCGGGFSLWRSSHHETNPEEFVSLKPYQPLRFCHSLRVSQGNTFSTYSSEGVRRNGDSFSCD